MEAIIFIGGGDHAKVAVGILRKLKCYRILGYVDLKDRGDVLATSYLGSDKDLVSLATGRKKLGAVLAVGQVGLGRKRQQIWMRLAELPLHFPVIVSPGAIVNEDVSVSEGTVVMDGAVINCSAKIGRGAIINTNSTIEHDVVIGDWVHVAPGATICGGVNVGRFSMVGAGATVIEGIRITEGCMIGAGATVVGDIVKPGVYVGCPARRIK
jgi:sugar O-acyltransferase (sialic acid O-acetyltransferase NeuD family)